MSKPKENAYNYNHLDYNPSNPAAYKEHIEFLKEIEKSEDNRLTVIENKGSQIAGQTGIIFSLLSLFVPIFIDKISDQKLELKILFIALMICAFLFYILTIHYAIRNYNIRKFVYRRAGPARVLEYQNKTFLEFQKKQVQDLLQGLNTNTQTNNRKATNVIHAFLAFRIANIFTALLGMLLCYFLFIYKDKEKTVVIGSPIKVQYIDSNFNGLIKILRQDKTLNSFKADSSLR